VGRGLGTGVNVRAAAPELSRLSVIPSCSGGRVVYSCAARPRGRCVVFGVSVLASVRGLGTGVDVGAATPELSALSSVPSCSGGSVVGSCGARPRGQCVAFGVLVLGSVRGLGIGVNVGAAALELSAYLLAQAEVSSACVVRGLEAGVWRWVVRFSSVFLLNWSCGFGYVP
jgi:hypothetical protein